MRRTRGGALSRFLEDLGDGDPVAVGTAAALTVFALGLGVLVLKVRRDLTREDSARAMKYGRAS